MGENKALRPDSSQLLDQALEGDFTLLGTITATTTKNNHDTAVPFNNTGNGLGGKVVMVLADTACYIATGTANTVAVTAANGYPLAAGDARRFTLKSLNGWLACLPVSGTTNLKVWELG